MAFFKKIKILLFLTKYGHRESRLGYHLVSFTHQTPFLSHHIDQYIKFSTFPVDAGFREEGNRGSEDGGRHRQGEPSRLRHHDRIWEVCKDRHPERKPQVINYHIKCNRLM